MVRPYTNIHSRTFLKYAQSMDGKTDLLIRLSSFFSVDETTLSNLVIISKYAKRVLNGSS